VPPNPRHRAILLLILLLALGLRLHQLDVQSLWYDEGVTARVAQMGAGELARWTADDIQPPLYYLLLGSWLRPFAPWPGNIAYLMRFFSAGFGLLLVALMASLARRLWTACAGLLTALVVAISPLMVYYSQEARMYAMLLFLTALATYWVVRLLDHLGRESPGAERKRLGFLMAYALTGLAAMYTHYFAGFALLALALYWAHVWVRESQDARALGGFALANLAILVGYLPWLPAMWRRFQVDASYWSGRLKLDEAVMKALTNFTVGAKEVFLQEEALFWLPWFGAAAILWLTALMMMRRRGAQRPVALILHWLLLPPAIILFLAYRTPKFNPRYLLISWPAWALLMGGGVAALWAWPPRGRRWVRPVMRTLGAVSLVLVVGVSALGLDNWYNDPNFAKTAWREAIAYMFAHRQPDEAVLLVSGHAYPVFDAYLPPDAPPKWQVPRFRLPEIEILDVNQVLGWEETARALNNDLADFGGVWLFLWQDEIVDPAHVVTTQLGRYAEEQPVPEFAFLGLRHYRLPPDFHVPEEPPMTQPGATFADAIELVGLEPGDGGLWLYWRSLRPDLPDLHAIIGIDRAGEALLYLDQRPVGYDFPTTHWNPGDIYPVWLPVDGDLRGARLRVRVYDRAVGEVLGDFETNLE
jgi:uncharacterized membrane protein